MSLETKSLRYTNDGISGAGQHVPVIVELREQRSME
jgi:hypothetical protein